MAIDIISYVLSKKYTDETAAEFGALKGASCQIQSIVKRDGQSIVTFLWENSSGEQRTSEMRVDDGTPIYVWESGNHYNYGDLVIYASAFYRCTTENSDIEFDDTHWAEIGSPDGNFDIVQRSEFLPPRFTSADRKMYYSIEDGFFWLWDGSTWVKQIDEIPVQGSTKPVQSGGVYSTIHDAVSAETSARQAVEQRLTAAISALNDDVDTNTSAITQLQTDLDTKVDKVVGKGLSTNDYDNAEKAKVADAQPQNLITPIVVDGVEQTTVEDALSALNNKTVDVDSSLSSTSENPVQNKVVKGALDNKQDDIGLSIVNGKLCVTYDTEV